MKDKLIYILNQFESYVSAAVFIFITVLLAAQVISRYCFNAAITWTEEVSTMLFVIMVYCGFAAAVTNRKHIRITFFTDMLPFKIRKVVMILSNLIFAAFCIYILPDFFTVINNLKDSTFPLTGFRKEYVYLFIPAAFILIAIRLVQECLRLAKEDEKDLGKSTPTIDLDAIERELEEERLRLSKEKEAEK